MSRHIPTISFQAVTFYDEEQKRQVVLLYALGTDGIVREYRGKEEGWISFPITKADDKK